VEIVICTGKVAGKVKEPFVSTHMAVSNEKGAVKGGHVIHGGAIDETLELVVVEAIDARLLRWFDSKTIAYSLNDFFILSPCAPFE
jgi:predicted DNA-binding protein with PD1-like motif